MRMPTLFILPFLAIIASCASAGHAPPTTPSPSATVETESAVPEPPRLAVADLPLWLHEPSDDEMVDVVLRHAYVTPALTFADIAPAESSIEVIAAGLAEAMDAREDMATSPMEKGVHEGMAFAGFRTIETTDDGTIYGGAVIVRQLPDSSYFAVIIGRWPAEATATMLSEFQDVVSAIYIEGSPPPEPDFEDWFREEDPNVIRLPPL